MVGIEVRRNQRPLWAAVSVLLGTGVLLTLVLATTARQSAETSAAASAQRAVQEVLAPALTPSDVAQPVTSRRAQELDALVTERLLSAGPSDRVRIWNPSGTVVFDTDRADIGVREPNERARIARVIERGRESVVDASAFRVLVPLRLEADGPVLGVAELAQPYGPLWSAASRPWRIGTLVLAGLFLLSVGLLALTFRDRPRAVPRIEARPAPADTTAPEDEPAYLRPEHREAVEARRAADARAVRAERLAEEANRRLADVQSELERVKAGALSVQDHAASAQLEAHEDLRERVRLLEAEREQLAERIRHDERVREELAQRAATPVIDPNLERRVAAAEERAGRAEASRAELEARAIELERSLTDAHDSKIELQRRLADAIAASEADETTEQLHRELDRLRAELTSAREQLAEQEARATERNEELEAMRRREKLQAALQRLHGGADVPAATAGAEPLEDRRASAPFVEQLSLDAKASVNAIQGMLLAMQHRGATDEATALVDKLRAQAGKLDHLVSDLQHADDLARGSVPLRYEHTALDPLIRRAIEEAPIDRDLHPITMQTEPVTIEVDPIRVEEIVSALLVSAAARGGARSPIIVSLEASDGGAILSVEDDAPSSDASISPVVTRFAEVQGGWARVEGRQGGGSAFRVFLPDHGADAAPDGGDDVTIMLPETSPHGLTAP
jgi:hypothetical protein